MNFNISWPSRGHNYLEEEINKLSKFLNSDFTLTQSNYVNQFEKDFGEYISNSNTIALMSAAHSLDLIAKRIKSRTKKRKILIPAHTYCATALSFIREGFKVKFIDIDEDELVVNNKIIENNLEDDVAAVVVVHLYGLVSTDIKRISETCFKNNVYLVEDCAQAMGGFLNGIHCGNFGDYACFSFHSQKNLTTLGEGGMLVCKDKSEINIFKELRINGHRMFERDNPSDYWKPAMIDVVETVKNIIPMKSTMNESQALMGIQVLKRFKKLKEYRRKISQLLYDGLLDLDSFRFQKLTGSKQHANHLFPIKLINNKIDRDYLINKLSVDYGIQAIVQFYPLNRYDLFKKNKITTDSLTNTNNFFDNMLSLPFSATITTHQVDVMVSSIRKIIKNV